MRLCLSLAFSCCLLSPAASAFAQQHSLQASTAGLTQVEQTFGKGVQIYTCQTVSGAPTWVFLGPSAILYQTPANSPNGPEQVATHSTGPVWQWSDSSGLFGTTVLSEPSSNANSIPQLLLSVQHFGAANGVLSGVNYVTRTNTYGGIAPVSGCDAEHSGTVADVPYTAIYTFYKAPAQ